ncbi:MAG: hypothetical protein HeimC3_47280 [Candidatus Heimdallarchaeota archaeon LC_3]|nr:MAG: hypothetical protein HeimC3_47280 [Candidatus Heimdallarchaeota archaeon LC_3]
MSSSSKKVRTINSQIDVIQKADVDALKQIAREIELHLDRMVESMFSSFWLVYKYELKKRGVNKSDLDFRKTDWWIKQVKFWSDKSMNMYLRNKMTLNDFLAKYIPKTFMRDSSESNI